MNARMLICASGIALAGALAAIEPAQAALTLIAVGGGGGGDGFLPGANGAGGVISESGRAAEPAAARGGVQDLEARAPTPPAAARAGSAMAAMALQAAEVPALRPSPAASASTATAATSAALAASAAVAAAASTAAVAAAGFPEEAPATAVASEAEAEAPTSIPRCATRSRPRISTAYLDLNFPDQFGYSQ
jgi:hypothetical protein